MIMTAIQVPSRFTKTPAQLPEVRLLEPRAIRRSRSSYGGPTIRLAKGL